MTTTQPPIRFLDGEAYERGMGVWSQMVGHIFLDWLAPKAGSRWVDIGCGNGAFTELLIARCAPAEVQAIDPSDGQLAFARTRKGVQAATFHQGDAMALPFVDDQFDAAVMALVLFFVPDPVKGVAEMVRVVRPGGLVCAYVWDIPGGGFPIEPIRAELARMGAPSAGPPRADISEIGALHTLWTDAGLEAVESRPISVQRVFVDFEDFWTTNLMVGGLGTRIAGMPPADIDRLKQGVQQRLPTDAEGAIIYHAWANAVRGVVPGG